MGEINNSKWEESTTSHSNSGGGIRRMKIEPDSKVIVRLTEDDFEHSWIHFIRGVDKDGNEAIRRVVCLGKEKCPICQLMKIIPKKTKSWGARHYFYYNVIDRNEQKERGGKFKVKLMQVGKKIHDQVYSKIKKYGLPTTYDLEVTRTGKNWNDTSYIVELDKQFPLTKKEKKRINKSSDKGGNYILSDFTAKQDIDEIMSMLKRKHRRLLKQAQEE